MAYLRRGSLNINGMVTNTQATFHFKKFSNPLCASYGRLYFQKDHSNSPGPTCHFSSGSGVYFSSSWNWVDLADCLPRQIAYDGSNTSHFQDKSYECHLAVLSLLGCSLVEPKDNVRKPGHVEKPRVGVLANCSAKFSAGSSITTRPISEWTLR